MEISQDREEDYQEILNRLERANESLVLLKNNNDICLRDLHKFCS